MLFSVAVAVGGIFLARTFYQTSPEISERMAERFAGAHRTLSNKYYVDELYNGTVVSGTMASGRGLWAFDRNVVDGAVNGSSWMIAEYGINTVRKGGLKAYTTIDPDLQRKAEDAVENSCYVCYPEGGPAAGLASVDPKNGAIVALASTEGYADESQFNYAWQAHRQPGSSFKTFVLTTAIKQGIDPDTHLLRRHLAEDPGDPRRRHLDGQQRRGRGRRHV